MSAAVLVTLAVGVGAFCAGGLGALVAWRPAAPVEPDLRGAYPSVRGADGEDGGREDVPLSPVSE